MSPLGLILLALASRLTAAAAGPRGFSRASGDLAQRPRPCRHAGDEVNSVAARAFLAERVLVGKARSRSPPREPGGRYAVTFVIVRSLREPAIASVPGVLRDGSQIRLPFRSKPPRPRLRSSALCQQNYNFTGKDVVRADIKRGGKYLLFLTGQGPLNFSLLGEPVIVKPKNLKAVREALCQKCRKPGTVRGLKDVEVKLGERLRLVCKSNGSPLPAISWYKDGRPLQVSMRLRIVYKKKRSVMEVARVLKEDAGRYECRGTDVTGVKNVTRAVVTVTSPLQPAKGFSNTTSLMPLDGGPCFIEAYCLNGGTCTYYNAVQEFVCQCSEGFKGIRCDTKDVINRSSMYRPMSYFCKLGISSSYYC